MKNALKKYMNVLVFAVAMLSANQVFAATEAEQKIMNVINGISGIVLIVAPSAGALALAWYGIQYYFAKESHDKAELKKSMVGVGWVSVIIASASAIVKAFFTWSA